MKFVDTVNTKVKKIFEDAFFDRLNMIYEKSVEAQSLEKRRLFIRLKKFLIKNRIIGFAKQNNERIMKQINAMPFKEVHQTEPWDVSFRSMNHPEIE